MRSLGVDIYSTYSITIIWHLKRSIWTKSASRRTWAIYKSRFGLCLAPLSPLHRPPKRSHSWEQLSGSTKIQRWRHQRRVVVVDVHVDLTGQTWLDVFVSRNSFLFFVSRLWGLVCCLVWSQLRVICCSAALRRICSCAHSPIHSFIPFIRSFVCSFVRSFVDPFTHSAGSAIGLFIFLRTWDTDIGLGDSSSLSCVGVLLFCALKRAQCGLARLKIPWVVGSCM